MSTGTDPRRRGRPANKSTDDTIAAVLTSARRLFAAKGYAGTSNREIAEAAGLAHTAIYNHFGSKAHLFTAVFVDVQDLLATELDRSVAVTQLEPSLPRALFDATEALRAADPSYVEFLASMYIEVRRDAELQRIFAGGASTFPVVDRLRELSAGSGTDSGDGDGDGDDQLWFWIAFALGLAQLSALADADTFTATLNAFRSQFTPGPTRVNAP
jgi:AcrR family transcriptional regulator